MTKPSEVEVSLSDLGKIKFDRIRSDLQKTKTMLIIHRDHIWKWTSVMCVCIKLSNKMPIFAAKKQKYQNESLNRYSSSSRSTLIVFDVWENILLVHLFSVWFIWMWDDHHWGKHSSHRNNIRRLAFRSVLSNLDLPVVFCFGYIIPKAVIIIIFTMLGVFQIVYIVEMEKSFFHFFCRLVLLLNK